MTPTNGNKPIIEPALAEPAPADLKKLTMKGLKTELDDLTDLIENEILNVITSLTNAVDKHQKAFKVVSSNQSALQQSIDLLAGEIMVLQTGQPETEKEAESNRLQAAELVQPPILTVTPEPEPEPLQYPEPVPQEDSYAEDLTFGSHQHVVLETIADSCIVMNDILLLCKAMKKVPELSDQTRIALLDLAGRRAGIEITPGMHVRAGVKMIVT